MYNMTGTAALYLVLIILITLAGGGIPLIRSWRRTTVRLFVSFGAGVLLGAAFLRMIPEAAGMIGPGIGVPLLSGFLFLFVIEKFIMVHACEAADCHYHTMGGAALVGLYLHSLIDGVALGAGIVMPEIGLFVFLAVLLHKFPASFSLTSILLHENMQRRTIVLIIAGFALTVPIGSLITIFLFHGVSQPVLGWLIAFSAGTFLHVAADDLLPEVHSEHDGRFQTLFTFLLGLGLMWAGSHIHA
ncbi:MAG TPA: transporter, Zip family protein [Bacteroidetes bacterium]|nr:transporter, Zip family protein [Bacteroidota bacterium]